MQFLIAEQVALKNHLYNRADSILKEAEAIENHNQTKIINNVMEETLRSIDIAYQSNKEEIEARMFDLALEGIANGKMDYAKDPILPKVIDTINKTVDRISKICLGSIVETKDFLKWRTFFQLNKAFVFSYENAFWRQLIG